MEIPELYGIELPFALPRSASREFRAFMENDYPIGVARLRIYGEKAQVTEFLEEMKSVIEQALIVANK